MARVYDCAIIGGGVAGLALAILLSKAQRSVILFEKETFPFHKVCGEYVSNESIPFLQRLGLDLTVQELPRMNELLLSSPSGISVKRPLDIGGVGISRYLLDQQLCLLAREAGVEVREGSKVSKVVFQSGQFRLVSGPSEFLARTTVGAYGKNSNIDVQLGRSYKAANPEQLYVAVKHHIRTGFNPGMVEMHNFPGGYCGLSAIEDGKINMSYICKASVLKKHGSIPNLEQQVLATNPFLKSHLNQAEFLFEKPLTISHLFFGIKQPVTGHILMLGDAAGNIAPLSGNGMSMALQSAGLAFKALQAFLNSDLTMAEMEAAYAKEYQLAFNYRIRVARQINYLFGNPTLTDLGFRVFKRFPVLIDLMSKQIHGKTF